MDYQEAERAAELIRSTPIEDSEPEHRLSGIVRRARLQGRAPLPLSANVLREGH